MYRTFHHPRAPLIPDFFTVRISAFTTASERYRFNSSSSVFLMIVFIWFSNISRNVDCDLLNDSGTDGRISSDPCYLYFDFHKLDTFLRAESIHSFCQQTPLYHPNLYLGSSTSKKNSPINISQAETGQIFIFSEIIYQYYLCTKVHLLLDNICEVCLYQPSQLFETSPLRGWKF